MRGPGGGGGVSTRGAGGGFGAMIVVETVLPTAGVSLVIVRFSIVVVDDWAKAGAANSSSAPAATSKPLILKSSMARAPRRCGRTYAYQQDRRSDHSELTVCVCYPRLRGSIGIVAMLVQA